MARLPEIESDWNMIFERKTYLERLLARRGNGFVKIITGVRRCGKSFLLFKLFKKRLLKSGMSASLERSGDSFRKVVVVGVPQPKYTDDKGIAYVGVMDLLLNPSVLDDLLT